MKKLWSTILLFIISTGICYAKVEVPSAIAVGLSYGSRAVSEFNIYAKSGVKISDVGTVKGNITIKKKDKDSLLITTDASSKKYTCKVPDDGISITPYSKKEYIKYNDVQYRGSLIIYRISDSDLTIVNVLNFEEYLYGVVPKEIATGHPEEALKAQAVAARSYAAMSIGKYKKWNFDVTNTTLDQAYGGYSAEQDDTNDAVDSTEGEVVTYKGEIVSTPFFSTSGGYTEDPLYVWGNSVDYLVPVKDEHQSENATYANWTSTFSKENIEKILTDNDIDIGDLLGISIVKKSESNSVVELDLEGTKDTYTIKNEKTRTFFGVKSQMYDISTDNEISVINSKGEVEKKSVSKLNALLGKKVVLMSAKMDNISVKGNKSTNCYNSAPDEYILAGKGYGHCVGMSQTGAIGMAKAGFSYDEILKWYYTGVKVEK